MPRTALTTAEIGDFRERLCAAATTLFARHGYDAVTMRGIAAELNCSPTTPYRYFEDKDEIFAMVRAAAFSRFAAALASASAGIEDTMDKLAAVSGAYVEFALADPDSYRLMFEMCQTDAERYPELVYQMERAFDCCRVQVRAAVAEGRLAGDPETVAHVLWAGIHGMCSLHLTELLSMGRSLETIMEPMLRTLIEGNLPQPPDGGTSPCQKN